MGPVEVREGWSSRLPCHEGDASAPVTQGPACFTLILHPNLLGLLGSYVTRYPVTKRNSRLVTTSTLPSPSLQGRTEVLEDLVSVVINCDSGVEKGHGNVHYFLTLVK